MANNATGANVGELWQTAEIPKIPAMFFPLAIAVVQNAWLLCVIG
jgi:hypothetical protein